jgi:signal transduction histidine kinase
MRLADFIRTHRDAIVAEWEAFAATRMPAAAGMTALELRDHADEILEAIAKDISTAQSEHAQHEKSVGRAPVVHGAPETAAETHAVLRSRSGFDINQLVAEYRALRASVLKLWHRANEDEVRDLDDVIRFNEAIDQALTESVTFFSAEVEQSRGLLLGMVGHDMRTPLNTIQLAGGLLSRVNAGTQVAELSHRVNEGALRLCALLDDLVDFNRSRLGLGIGLAPAPMELASAFAEELELLRFTNPENSMALEVEGDASGHWDRRRLQQVLSNLVRNAVKHGTKGGPIRVRITGTKDSVSFEVLNEGKFKHGASVERMFDPLKRGTTDGDPGGDSLGLGIYIAREITVAHGGQINVHAHPAATVFAVSLPRVARVAQA